MQGFQSEVVTLCSYAIVVLTSTNTLSTMLMVSIIVHVVHVGLELKHVYLNEIKIFERIYSLHETIK